MARFLLKTELLLSWVSGTWVSGTEVELSSEESHHLAKVLRMQVGEECELINGLGIVAKAKIQDNHAKRARCLILEVRKEPPLNRIHIAFAIPKSNALDFIIHRCTEAGVGSFQPLVTDHSSKISSWNEDRWERVVLETSKQCQEAYFPVVLNPMGLNSWLLEKRDRERKLIFCDEQARHDVLTNVSTEHQADFLIGSEGGWSETERGLLQKEGRGLGLGKNRLRAETACLVALTLLKKHWNEL